MEGQACAGQNPLSYRTSIAPSPLLRGDTEVSGQWLIRHKALHCHDYTPPPPPHPTPSRLCHYQTLRVRFSPLFVDRAHKATGPLLTAIERPGGGGREAGAARGPLTLETMTRTGLTLSWACCRRSRAGNTAWDELCRSKENAELCWLVLFFFLILRRMGTNQALTSDRLPDINIDKRDRIDR